VIDSQSWVGTIHRGIPKIAMIKEIDITEKEAIRRGITVIPHAVTKELELIDSNLQNLNRNMKERLGL